jgi:hypothetical protein
MNSKHLFLYTNQKFSNRTKKGFCLKALIFFIEYLSAMFFRTNIHLLKNNFFSANIYYECEIGLVWYKN